MIKIDRMRQPTIYTKAVLLRREGNVWHGELSIGGTIYLAEWDATTGDCVRVGNNSKGAPGDTDMQSVGTNGRTVWAVDVASLIDWSKPIEAEGLGAPRKCFVLSTHVMIEGHDEPLVMIKPVQPGWDNENPLLRTQDNKGVPTPWGGRNGIAVKIINKEPERIVVLANVTKENLNTTGEANAKFVFEDGVLKDASVL